MVMVVMALVCGEMGILILLWWGRWGLLWWELLLLLVFLFPHTVSVWVVVALAAAGRRCLRLRLPTRWWPLYVCVEMGDGGGRASRWEREGFMLCVLIRLVWQEGGLPQTEVSRVGKGLLEDNQKKSLAAIKGDI